MYKTNWYQAETWFKDEVYNLEKEWQQNLEDSEDDFYELKKEKEHEEFQRLND